MMLLLGLAWPTLEDFAVRLGNLIHVHTMKYAMPKYHGSTADVATYFLTKTHLKPEVLPSVPNKCAM
jgi:hypothetical protein